jgi:arylsulfatase A-like enzyme
LDGISLRPLLVNPAAAWDRPAITTHGYGNHGLRTERWRYIRYRDGSEELYDHETDPNEWTNLADNPEYASVLNRLRAALPEHNEPPPDPAPSDKRLGAWPVLK